MFDTPYVFRKVSIDTFSTSDPYKKIYYQFKTINRKYFVTVEFYSFNIIAVKFRDNDHKNSAKAYGKIFNDYDSFRVIGTCIHIMGHIWKEYPSISFAFHASLRLDRDSIGKKKFTTDQANNRMRSRYNIYSYGMLNFFSEENFTHIRDRTNSLYVLMNKKQNNPSRCLKQMSQYLLQNTNLIFDPEYES